MLRIYILIGLFLSTVVSQAQKTDSSQVGKKADSNQGSTKRNRDKNDILYFEIEGNKYIKRFKNDTFSLRYLDVKNSMDITIKDINPFLYEITMREYQNDYLNEMKNENIQTVNFVQGNLAVNFPEPKNKRFDFIPGDKESEDSAIKYRNEIEKNQRQINAIYNEKIYPKQKEIADSSASYKVEKVEELQKAIDTADYDVAKLVLRRRSLFAELAKIKNEKEEAVGMQDKINTYVNEYNRNLIELQKLFDFYQAIKILVYTPSKSIKDLMGEKKEILWRYLNDIKGFFRTQREIKSFELTFQFHDILRQIKKTVEDIKEAYHSLIMSSKGSASERELATNLKALIESIDEDQKKLSTNALDMVISNTAMLYNAINEDMFTQHYVIDNVKEKTDYVQFQFDAIPKPQSQASIVPKPISYKVVMPVKHGVQMNVSSGLFFNMGLSNEDWYYKPMNQLADTFQMVKAAYKLGDVFTPSVGLLLHVYRRSPYATKLAGSFGFSTNAKEINYYLGGSFILGKSQRCVVSLGLAGGQKEVLKGSFGEGLDDRIVTKEFKDKNPTILTIKRFKVGAFLSFTFNLWGKATKDFNFESIGAGQTGQASPAN